MVTIRPEPKTSDSLLEIELAHLANVSILWIFVSIIIFLNLSPHIPIWCAWNGCVCVGGLGEEWDMQQFEGRTDLIKPL